MKERATLATIAVSIVTVKADVKKGEKLFNAYMMVSIRFELLLVIDGWVGSARLGYSLSSLLLSIVTNGGLCLIALWLHYRRKKQKCQVFF